MRRVVAVLVGWLAAAGCGGGAPGGDGPASPDAGADDARDLDAGPSADAGSDPIPGPPESIWCGILHHEGEVLVDLGQAAPIESLEKAGDRVVSRDGYGHWVLHDAANRTYLAKGTSERRPCDTNDIRCPLYPLDLAGATLLEVAPTSASLYDADDGQLLTTIATSATSIGLAADGSYVWAASASGLEVWSRTGVPLLERAGDDSSAKVFGDTAEIRIAGGPAGPNVIERVSLADGASSTTPPFEGTFHAWFVDGSKFLTRANLRDIAVYSKEAVQLAPFVTLGTLENLTGQGNFFWTGGRWPLGNRVRVYRIGDSTSTRYSGRAVAWAGAKMAYRATAAANVWILDFSGDAVTETPLEYPDEAVGGIYAIDADGGWATGGGYGVVHDVIHADEPDGPLPLTCGAAYGLAGSASGHVAIATAAGRVLYLDTAGTRALVTALPTGLQWGLDLSGDGSVLLSIGEPIDPVDDSMSLTVLDMPSGDVIYHWPYFGNLSFTYFYKSLYMLSESGTRLAVGSYVTDLTRSTTYTSSDTEGYAPVSVSPSGMMYASNTDICFYEGGSCGGTTAVIYQNDSQVGTADGLALGWLDEDRLLVQKWTDAGYDGVNICDRTGAVLASVDLPPFFRFSVVDETHVYSRDTDAIYSLVDGSVTWASSDTTLYEYADVFRERPADLAGTFVVHAVRDHIRIDPH